MKTIEVITLPGIELPEQHTIGSAGFDLLAHVDIGFKIFPGDVRIIRTGVSVFIHDPDVFGMVCSRSSLMSSGLVVQTGIIDSDYQGEISLVVTNVSNTEHEIEPRTRIGQILFVTKHDVQLSRVSRFSSITGRGSKGFGSTGK